MREQIKIQIFLYKYAIQHLVKLIRDIYPEEIIDTQFLPFAIYIIYVYQISIFYNSYYEMYYILIIVNSTFFYLLFNVKSFVNIHSKKQLYLNERNSYDRPSFLSQFIFNNI